MLDKQTILQTVIATELQDYIEKEKKSLYESQDLLSAFSLSDGSFVKELNSSSGAVNYLLNDETLKYFSQFDKVSPLKYMEQLGTNILKIEEEMSLPFAIDLTISLYEQLGETLAGVVAITPTGALINLLHHITALEMVPYITADSSKPEVKVSKVVVYTYKDLEKIKQLYDIATTEEVETFIDDLIGKHLLAASAILKPRYVKLLKNETNISQRSITQHYAVSKDINEVKDTEYYITAHQLLTKGTFVPYYGVTIVALKTNNVSGHHVSFTKGANISNHEGRSGSVCCGSKSNRTIEGLRTQHHSNLSSPYQSQCMCTSSYTYIKKCIERSISIYKTYRNTDATTSNTTEDTSTDI